MNIDSLSVGGINSYEWGRNITSSAIGKNMVEEAFLSKEGFDGDTVANPKFHGGPERAVCFYPLEHYEKWESEFNVRIRRPGFGENISILGMKEEEVFIGDTYELGDSIIQISQGRIPCATISKFNQIEGLLKRVVETGYTGYFFRVLKEGNVHKNSTLKLIDRTQSNISILDANLVYFHDRTNKEAIERVLNVKELAPVWRTLLTDLLKK